MPFEMSNYYFKMVDADQIVEAISGIGEVACEASIQIQGTGLLDVVTVEVDHGSGTTVINGPFANHVDEGLNARHEDLIGETVTAVRVIDDLGNEEEITGLTFSDISGLIDVTAADSTASNRVELAGTNLGIVGSLELEFTTLGIVTKLAGDFAFHNATEIRVSDPAWAGDTLESVTAIDNCETGEDTLSGLNVSIDA